MSFNHNQSERNVCLLHLGQEIVVQLLLPPPLLYSFC
jgi:hypothetical protein